MEFNTLSHLDPYIEKELAKNMNRRFSAMFRDNRMRVPLIGDFPVMAYLAYLCRKFDRTLTRAEVIKACQSSIEFKDLPRNEKSSWVDGVLLRNAQ